MSSLIEIVLLVLEKIFFNINICKYGFPCCGPSRPEQFWIYIMSESFHVNMTYSDSVVLEKKFFKWPHSIFAFLDYLPFVEDLVHYLNNSWFPLPKDDLCQVWLKLAGWFWRRRFFQYKHM
jgi:hypothetical protein